MEVPAMVFQGLLMRKERSFYCTRKIASGDDLVRLVVSNDLFPLTALFGVQKKMRDSFLRELSLVFFLICITLFNIMLRMPDLPRKVLQMYSEI